MSNRAMGRPLNKTVPEGGKRCGHPACHRVKPVECFHKNRWNPDGLAYWCKSCRAAADGRRHETPAYKAWAERNREKLRDQLRARAARDGYSEREKRYRQTPRGRLMTRRCKARQRLREATSRGDAAAMARLAALVAEYDAAAERMRLREAG